MDGLDQLHGIIPGGFQVFLFYVVYATKIIYDLNKSYYKASKEACTQLSYRLGCGSSAFLPANGSTRPLEPQIVRYKFLTDQGDA